MAKFIARRILFLILTLLIVSMVIFAVTEILPGDVASMILGQQATEQDLATLRARLGLDRPAPERYIEWLTGMLRGDWGESLRLGVPVAPILIERMGNSLTLAAIAFVFGVPLAILLGVLAGLTRGKWPDSLVTIGTLIAVSLPEFVTSILLIIVFASWLKILPPTSMIDPSSSPLGSVRFLVLPALTLTMVMTAHIARMTRSSMIEVMGSNYVRTAILKGLPRRRVIFYHALRNSLLPTITVVAINVGWLMGGLIVVETVFAYPGMGQLLLLAVGNHDVPLLQAVTLVIAAIYALANLGADMLYRTLNPRIRFQ
ncbi:MAG: ABC transporter permease [Litorilinea sp.]